MVLKVLSIEEEKAVQRSVVKDYHVYMTADAYIITKDIDSVVFSSRHLLVI